MLGLGAIITLIFKAIYKFFYFLVVIIAHLLLYFGLWIPTLYMIICGILMLTGGLDLAVMSTNTIIFYIGLALTLLGSVIISIRNLILKPISELVATQKAKKQLKQIKEENKKQELYKKNPAKYFVKYEGQLPHKSHPVYTQERSDRENFAPPLIYRSNNNPEIIIHEYKSHFKVFKEYPNGEIKLIDIKEKPEDFDEEKPKKHAKRTKNKRH